jgi:hypothetical protein
MNTQLSLGYFLFDVPLQLCTHGRRPPARGKFENGNLLMTTIIVMVTTGEFENGKHRGKRGCARAGGDDECF